MSLGIFSTTSHCIAMTLIRTPSDFPPAPPAPFSSPQPNHPPLFSELSNLPERSLSLGGASNSLYERFPKQAAALVGGWAAGGNGGGGVLISKSGDERQIGQIGPLISYQYTAVAAPLSLNLKKSIRTIKGWL